jgi:uncharacterized protein YhaN
VVVIIRRIRVRRFRKLADQTLDCGPGLNVICGPNDVGKSTLHLAFSAVLYPIKPSEARSYGTWGEDDPGEITMEFEAAGGPYRLRKDLGSRKVALEGPRTRTEDPKLVEQRVGELLGLTSLSLFRATAHISQWDLAGVQKEQQEIGTRLARIVTGGDADAGRVLAALDERIRRLEVGLARPAKSPGPLKSGQDRLAALALAQRRLAAEVEAIEWAAAERDRVEEQIAALEQQVRDDEALLAANRRLLELDAQWTRAHGRVRELESLAARIAKAMEEVDAAGRDETLRRPEIDRERLSLAQDAEMRARLLDESASEASPAAAQARPEAGAAGGRPDARPAWFDPRVLAALGGLSAASGIAAAALGWAPPAIAALALLALFAAVGLAVPAWRARSRAQAAAAVARAVEEAERRQAEERRSAREAALAEMRGHLEALGAGTASVAEAAALAERRESARRRLLAAQDLLAQLLGGRTPDAVAEEHRAAVLELAMLRAQREDPDLVLRRLDASAFHRLQAEASARRARLEEAVAARHRLEGQLSGRSPHEELARVEEEMAEAGERLDRYRRFAEVLRLARAVLFEAHRSTVVPGKALLEERAGRYLRRLSAGAYDRVVVDEQTLAPRVWVGPPKEWADVASREIGSGAVDQCYLALRLALVDVLCGDRRPPLFLDDPFLAYDEHRQHAALACLRDLARGRQIFLLTCRREYDRYADHLIPLGGLAAPLSPV